MHYAGFFSLLIRFRKLIEIWGIEKPSAITVLYSGTRELVKKIHEPVTIFTRLSIVKFYEELREKIEFWNNLDSISA